MVYDYDTNTIHGQAFSARLTTYIIEAYEKILHTLTSNGISPKLLTIYNEIFAALKDLITTSSLDVQLVPPHLHRRNSAEQAIRTFKSHFISILCGNDPSFPINLWDKLLPQAILILNLLRTSRLNPKLSAYAQVWGPFDYNRIPLAPLGKQLLIHEKNFLANLGLLMLFLVGTLVPLSTTIVASERGSRKPMPNESQIR